MKLYRRITVLNLRLDCPKPHNVPTSGCPWGLCQCTNVLSVTRAECGRAFTAPTRTGAVGSTSPHYLTGPVTIVIFWHRGSVTSASTRTDDMQLCVLALPGLHLLSPGCPCGLPGTLSSQCSCAGASLTLPGPGWSQAAHLAGVGRLTRPFGALRGRWGG